LIETVLVDVEDSRGAIKRKVRLSNDGKPLTITPDQVEVVITVEEEQVTREFDHVEVRAKDFTGTYTVSPQWVSIRLSGPKSVVEKLQLNSESVYLNLTGAAAGEHTVALLFNLPPEVKVLDQKPQRFRVRITKPAA
jgi:YbbR domain-containing protein